MQKWRDFGVQLLGNGARLGSVPLEEIRDHLANEGLVFLRDFDVDVEQLHDLTQGLFDRPLVYGGAREQVSDDDTIQTVDLGQEHLGLHVELAYVPVRPDLAVFHCQVPAAVGGETTFGDGAAVYEALAPETQHLLSQKRVRYHTVARSITWQRMFKTDSQADILALGNAMDEVELEFDHEGDLHVHFLADAIFERRSKTVYAESAHRFGRDLEAEWVQGLKKSSSNLEDGPLADEIREELSSVCLELEEPARWEPGDVAIVDNWSVLHGRTPYSDSQRRILASFGYAAWARPETAFAV